MRHQEPDMSGIGYGRYAVHEHFAAEPDAGRVEAVFARRAAECPDRVAVWDDGGSVTYGQLWQQALGVAGVLRQRGVAAGDLVAVLGHGSRDTILGLLGVLAAGAGFVPIDPTFPVARAARMIQLSGAVLVLVADNHEPAAEFGVPAVHVRTPAAGPSGAVAGGASCPAGGSPDALAYVMFTSGSTGEPKPVGVAHRGITGLVLRPGPLRRSAGDGVLVHMTMAFDASMLEIWSALLVGASVVCARSSTIALHETAELVSDPRVTAVVLTPSIFALIVDHYLDALGTLRVLMVGGDVMPAGHAARMRAAWPDVLLLNVYGPTENSVVSTAFPVPGQRAAGSGPVPIGTAVAGTRCYVLDERLRPVPGDQAGELFLGGDRLAIGYLGNPALTAERFLPDPFGAEPGARMYRTGDRARLLAGGVLQFEGRRDDEVKIRGFRVNLAEARAALTPDPGVREVVVVPVGAGIDRSLVAFVRPAGDRVDPGDLRTRAWERAPRHVVPGTIVLVDTFPCEPSGKVDRDALLELWRHGQARPEPAAPLAGTDDEARLAMLWQQRCGAAPDPEQDFFSAGGTSLGLIQLIEDIGAQFGVALDFADVYGLRSFTELVVLVREHVPMTAHEGR